MNTKDKSAVGLALIYAVLFLVFNTIVFLLCDSFTNVFWISYAFVVISFITNIICTVYSFKDMTVEAAFYGIPLASLALYYLIAETIIGSLFIAFQQAGFKLAFIVQLVLFAIFMVTAVIAFMARTAVEEINQSYKSKADYNSRILVEVEILMERCAEPKLKESLRELAEVINYSDPMSNESVAAVEDRILQRISELKYYVEQGHRDESEKAIDDIKSLYIERNKRLIISK